LWHKSDYTAGKKKKKKRDILADALALSQVTPDGKLCLLSQTYPVIESSVTNVISLAAMGNNGDFS